MGLVFQIGLDKCGTTSLSELFSQSGYRCLHWLYDGGQAYIPIRKNIIEGKKPLDGIKCPKAGMEYEFISDIKEFFTEGGREKCEFALPFVPIFEKAYPNAKFILNTRNKDNWIRSRLSSERFEREKIVLAKWKMTKGEYIEFASREWETHNAVIRSYFKYIPNKLIEFNIEEDDPSKLVDFMKPEFSLNEKKWQKCNPTVAFKWQRFAHAKPPEPNVPAAI